MIVSSRVDGVDGLAARLSRTLSARLAADAVNAAASAITTAAAREGVPLQAQVRDDGLRIGTDDPAAVQRETGTLETPAAPWLQPLLSGLRRRR